MILFIPFNVSCLQHGYDKLIRPMCRNDRKRIDKHKLDKKKGRTGILRLLGKSSSNYPKRVESLQQRSQVDVIKLQCSCASLTTIRRTSRTTQMLLTDTFVGERYIWKHVLVLYAAGKIQARSRRKRT